jgi:hypothetical protein
MLGTTFEKCLIMEGEVELGQVVDVDDSIAEFSKIDNESVLPESEANLDEHVISSLHQPSNHDEKNDDNYAEQIDKNNDNKGKSAPFKNPNKNKKGSNSDSFKYQELDLSWYGRHLIGFRTIFNEYLEDLEVYTVKTPHLM